MLGNGCALKPLVINTTDKFLMLIVGMRCHSGDMRKFLPDLCDENSVCSPDMQNVLHGAPQYEELYCCTWNLLAVDEEHSACTPGMQKFALRK